MRRRIIPAAIVAVIAVTASVAFWQRSTLSSQFGRGEGFVVESVQKYEPKDLPAGFQLSVTVNAEELRIGDGKHVEIDVSIDPTLAKQFTVRDAVMTRDKVAIDEIQPFFSQTPPRGVDARLLFSGLRSTKYQLELYFAPREGQAEPAIGMKYFETPELRNKNIRIAIANR